MLIREFVKFQGGGITEILKYKSHEVCCSAIASTSYSADVQKRGVRYRPRFPLCGKATYSERNDGVESHETSWIERTRVVTKLQQKAVTTQNTPVRADSWSSFTRRLTSGNKC